MQKTPSSTEKWQQGGVVGNILALWILGKREQRGASGHAKEMFLQCSDSGYSAEQTFKLCRVLQILWQRSISYYRIFGKDLRFWKTTINMTEVSLQRKFLTEVKPPEPHLLCENSIDSLRGGVEAEAIHYGSIVYGESVQKGTVLYDISQLQFCYPKLRALPDGSQI